MGCSGGRLSDSCVARVSAQDLFDVNFRNQSLQLRGVSLKLRVGWVTVLVIMIVDLFWEGIYSFWDSRKTPRLHEKSIP